MNDLVQHKCKLVVCTPCPVIPNGCGGSKLAPVTMQWHRHRMNLQIPYGYNAAELACDGFEVGNARTKVVGKCREVGAEFLFFIDYDVLVPPNAFKQLMYRATATHPSYDIFSGVYCAKERPTIPIIYKGWGNGPFWDWTVGDVLDDGIVGVPMGCCLLRLSLFDRLTNTPEKPWFKTQDLQEGNPLDPHDLTDLRGTVTEDLWFCRRAVDEAGCKILVDTSVQCGHISHGTGEVFVLPEDCPPVKRAGIVMPSDIEIHLPKLRELASHCDRVVEFGVRDGHSTKALLAGKPKALFSYDVMPCSCLDQLNPDGTAFRFVLENVETADIPFCDLLLVDSRHTAEHVRKIIQRHRPKVYRWFAFHDTTTYGRIGEDGGPGILEPINEELRDWKVIYQNPESHGMIIFERP